jgi:hypothetical protein
MDNEPAGKTRQQAYLRAFLFGFSMSAIRDNYTEGSLGEYLREKIRPDSRLAFVSAYFTIYAYDRKADALFTLLMLRTTMISCRSYRSLMLEGRNTFYRHFTPTGVEVR